MVPAIDDGLPALLVPELGRFGSRADALREGPPQYGGSGWSGASSGQDPSEVLGGPAAASVEIGRSQPTSGRSSGPAGVRHLVCLARSGGESVQNYKTPKNKQH